MAVILPIAPLPDSPIPATAGVGLKAQHTIEIAERLPDELGWLEVHSENYFGEGGAALQSLSALRSHYPISLHGVGLSLGSAGPLDTRHLDRLARLNRHIEPGLVSEHLSWSIANGDYLNDLIPLPYTEEALDNFARHVEQMQDALQRRVLIENPSAYLRYEHSTISECEFLLAVAKRSGCGVLLDVNNVFVSAHNLGFDALAYIDAIPGHLVGEIHLGGHCDVDVGGEILKIDDHGSTVRDEVWELYTHAVRRFGPKPTLIEWDSDVPELDVLLSEARRANAVLTNTMEPLHACAR
ncbi:MAG TPA: DUF692 domain-containing protein [Magnetovibrio sp.]